jgi:hypothetical protein
MKKNKLEKPKFTPKERKFIDDVTKGILVAYQKASDKHNAKKKA